MTWFRKGSWAVRGEDTWPKIITCSPRHSVIPLQGIRPSRPEMFRFLFSASREISVKLRSDIAHVLFEWNIAAPTQSDLNLKFGRCANTFTQWHHASTLYYAICVFGYGMDWKPVSPSTGSRWNRKKQCTAQTVQGTSWSFLGLLYTHARGNYCLPICP